MRTLFATQPSSLGELYRDMQWGMPRGCTVDSSPGIDTRRRIYVLSSGLDGNSHQQQNDCSFYHFAPGRVESSGLRR